MTLTLFLALTKTVEHLLNLLAHMLRMVSIIFYVRFSLKGFTVQQLDHPGSLNLLLVSRSDQINQTATLIDNLRLRDN
jgi:hypothetical protein